MYVGVKNFPPLSRKKKNDSARFRVVHHHVEFALPFLHRKFLVADHENKGIAFILLIDKRGCELQLAGRAIVGERSFGGPGGQVTGGCDRCSHGPVGRSRSVKSSEDVDRLQAGGYGGYNSCEAREDRDYANGGLRIFFNTSVTSARFCP